MVFGMAAIDLHYDASVQHRMMVMMMVLHVVGLYTSQRVLGYA